MKEARHNESIKTLVEVCKASGVNFALLCTYNIDMAMKSLYDAGEITTTGKFKNDDYFRLEESRSTQWRRKYVWPRGFYWYPQIYYIGPANKN